MQTFAIWARKMSTGRTMKLRISGGERKNATVYAFWCVGGKRGPAGWPALNCTTYAAVSISRLRGKPAKKRRFGKIGAIARMYAPGFPHGYAPANFAGSESNFFLQPGAQK